MVNGGTGEPGGGSLSRWPRPRPTTPKALLGRSWVLIDVETSGLRPYADRVLSVAAVAIDEYGRTEREFATLLNPGCDPGAVHIHGVTRARLAGQPAFQEALPALLDISRDRVLVAHNAGFDHDFLEHEAARLAASFAVRERLCTLTLSRRLGLRVPDHRLPTLAAYWDIRQVRHHDAVDDVRVLAGVFQSSAGLAADLGLPLPIVDCTRHPRPEPFPASVTKTPCAYRYPGPWRIGTPLTQGMKVAITGPTELARELLIQRCVDAGLDVTGTVSSVTNLLVCNDPTAGTGKLTGARRHGTAVVDEPSMIRLLGDIRAGVRKDAPVAKAVTTPPVPRPTTGPLAGRRVLTLGGTHELAGQVRARVAELGGVASVNLTAAVTDVVLLGGGTGDTRYGKARARELTVLSWPDLAPAGWPERSRAEPIPAELPCRTPAPVAPTAPIAPAVLIRGEVMDLPADPVWSVNVSWQSVAGSGSREVDVVAFILDESEKVTTDADFVFYNQPISEDAAVQVAENGSSEQGVRIDLTALPTWCRRVEIAAAIGGAGTFGDVGAMVVDADAGDDIAGTARTVATATLDAATTERTMLLASIYRRGDDWRLRAVGQGYDTGLLELATSFGVDVDTD